MPPEVLTRLVVKHLRADQDGSRDDGPEDLTSIGDPRHLTRQQLVRQILAPAFDQGWLSMDDPVHFIRVCDKLATEEIRDWAEKTLRAHPWPPGLYVPSFAEWVEDRRWLGMVTLTERQRYWFEASIGASAADWFCKPRKYTLLCIVAGKGSGKDLFASFIQSYLAWTITRMRNPWFHFYHPVGEPFDLVNVAQNQRQARRVYYTKLRRALLRPTFRDILDKKLIHADETFFFKKLPDEAEPLECLRLHSLNSQNEAAEGLNTFGYVLDEYDAFRTKEGNSNAEMMLNTLQSSSRFADQQVGLIITYTRALNGPALKALGQCGNRGGENPEWWGDLAPSWEVLPWRCFIPTLVDGKRLWTNPTGQALIAAGRIQDALKRRVLGERPDLEMARTFRTNREKFDQLFACKPPASISSFIQEPAKIDEAIEAARDFCLEPIAKVIPTVTRILQPESGRVREFVARKLDGLQMRPGVTYFVGGDAGTSQDSFALCVAHIVPPKESGQICPACWRERHKRLAKHYVPEPVPSRAEDPSFIPDRFPCDYCGAMPPQAQDPNPTITPPFWGFARPSGQLWERPVILGHERDGTEIYQEEDLPVRDAATGVTRWDRRVVYEQVYLPLVVEDLLIEWRPDKVNHRTVDHENVKDVILQLSQAGKIGAVRIDRWQADMLVQLLQKAGLDAATEVFSNPAQMAWYGNFKNLLNMNQLLLLPDQEDNPAPAKARRELREVELINGNKIDHPDESVDGGAGSKDMTDAEGLAFWLCTEHETAKGLIDTGNANAAYAAMAAQSETAARALIDTRGVVGEALREVGFLR